MSNKTNGAKRVLFFFTSGFKKSLTVSCSDSRYVKRGCKESIMLRMELAKNSTKTKRLCVAFYHKTV